MTKRKDHAAARLGRKGGRQTAKNQTPEERSASARKAALARWRSKAKKKPGR